MTATSMTQAEALLYLVQNPGRVVYRVARSDRPIETQQIMDTYKWNFVNNGRCGLQYQNADGIWNDIDLNSSMLTSRHNATSGFFPTGYVEPVPTEIERIIGTGFGCENQRVKDLTNAILAECKSKYQPQI